MTYNPYSLAQSYAQYGQAKKKQAANAKKTTPSFSFSNDNDSGSTYDEVPQTVTTGLGSKLSFDKPEDDRTLDQKIYESMKSFGASMFGKPEVKDTYILEAYNSDPMFVIPEPTPVVETAIDEGTYDFIDMSKLMNEPRQPRTEANMDTTPEIGGYDYAPLETTAPGLMSPPSMEQNIPNVPPLTYTDRAVTMAKALPSAEYTIQVGDTLGELAEVTGSTVEELMALNDIEDKDRIIAGETIKIPIRRDEDAEIVTQATSMEELKPIKASYTISEPSLQLDNTDPDAKNYQSFRQGITPIEMLRTTGDNEYVSADYMSELEILARTIEAEAGGESKKGKLAVGAVIKNRADQNRFGNDIRSVILFPQQFSPWNKYTGAAKGEQGKDMLGEKMKPSKDSYDAAKKILSGKYIDPTGGATHFLNPKVGTKPSWYDKLKEHGIEKIGKHEFGDPDKSNWQYSSGIDKSLRPKARPLGLPQTGTDI